MRKLIFILLFIPFILNAQIPFFTNGNQADCYVVIGTQVWSCYNLDVYKLNDGTNIPQVTNATTWAALTTPAYCWYNNDSVTYKEYGRLYNWYAVNTGKLCPIGWHVPSVLDIDILNTYLGASGGGKMKEAGLSHWTTPNTGATNSSGFRALPGGHRSLIDYVLIYYVLHDQANFWLTDEGDVGYGLQIDLYFDDAGLNYSDEMHKYDGQSVRCLKN